MRCIPSSVRHAYLRKRAIVMILLPRASKFNESDGSWRPTKFRGSSAKCAASSELPQLESCSTPQLIRVLKAGSSAQTWRDGNCQVVVGKISKENEALKSQLAEHQQDLGEAVLLTQDTAELHRVDGRGVQERRDLNRKVTDQPPRLSSIFQRRYFKGKRKK